MVNCCSSTVNNILFIAIISQEKYIFTKLCLPELTLYTHLERSVENIDVISLALAQQPIHYRN